MQKATVKRLVFASGLLLFGVSVIGGWLGWEHVEFWKRFEFLGRNEQGYPEFRHRGTSIVFVRIPGGSFMMGSAEIEEGRSQDEGPVHRVALDGFLIGKYEVSQAQYEAVMGSNPSSAKGAELPVETVTWTNAKEFCERAGLKLPTEA